MTKMSLALGLACVFFAWTVQAQQYPSRPTTIVIPQQAGSNSDSVVRPMIPFLQEALGQPVIVDNRAGANGMIGAEYVARAKADGYTLLLAASSVFVANSHMYKKLAYDPVKDFRPIVGLGRTSMMFMARPDFAAKTLDEFIAYAKSQPQPLNVAYGSSTAQVAIAMLASASGVKLNPIPYKGSPQLLTDLMGGTIQVGVVDVASGSSYIKSGRAVGLAITDSSRSSFVPQVPALSEKYPGVALVSWTALVAPAGTPDEVIKVWHEAVRKSIDRPEVLERFASSGVTPSLLAPAVLEKTIRDDLVRWGALMRSAGIEKE